MSMNPERLPTKKATAVAATRRLAVRYEQVILLVLGILLGAVLSRF